MPSLRQRVTTYFRQLSFIAEPREGARLSTGFSAHNPSDHGCFITRYLEGRLEKPFGTGDAIKNGKEPCDLPELRIGDYSTGPTTITAACTGPDEGLTGVKRARLHLSAGPDIDFIDINQEQDISIRRSPTVTVNSNVMRHSHKADQNANKSAIKSNTKRNSKAFTTDVAGDNNRSVDVGVAITTDNSDKIIVGKTNTGISTNNSVAETKCGGATLGQQQPTQPAVKTSIRNSDCLNKNEEASLDNAESIIMACQEVDNSNVTAAMAMRSLELEPNEPIAGVTNWKMDNDHAFGLSVSLYEKNFITHESAGSPIADCYGLVARENGAVLAIADGVNWGEGAQLAARSAIHGCLEYIDTAVFGQGPGGTATTTREVFVSLLRSVWKAHACILEVGGALSTLTVAVVLPLRDTEDRSVVCACNVGDSFGYVYSKKFGVREFTQGSHDITSMRDMRDALGAIGPYDGDKPELGNLTLSMTTVHPGDIVFLTSDGISDNFDPVVGKFAEPLTSESQAAASQKAATKEPHLAPKRQNKSASAIYSRASAMTSQRDTKDVRLSLPPTHNNKSNKSASFSSADTTTTASGRSVRQKKTTDASKPNAITSPTTSSSAASSGIPSRPKYMRSHTVIEPTAAGGGGGGVRIPRGGPAPTAVAKYAKSASGLPLVTGAQRHILTLLRLEDLLCYGINGTLRPCTGARKLCHLLVDFARMITAAKRKILEQRELFYKHVAGADGVKKEIELNRLQQRSARKRIVDGATFSSLPGKLDHASVVAFTVTSGGGCPSSRVMLSEMKTAGAVLVETDF